MLLGGIFCILASPYLQQCLLVGAVPKGAVATVPVKTHRCDCWLYLSCEVQKNLSVSFGVSLGASLC